MPRYPVKHGDVYLVWSTIVDAPITFGCSIEQLRNYWKQEYGREGLERLDSNMERRGVASLADEAAFNRAGANETCLTLEQLVDYYIVIGRDPEAPLPIGGRSEATP